MSEALQPQICNACQGSGAKGLLRCGVCKGMAIGAGLRGKWLFWSFPLTRYSVALVRVRKIFEIIRTTAVLLFGFNAWVWAFFLLYKNKILEQVWAEPLSVLVVLEAVDPLVRFLGWLGVVFFSYAWYRTVIAKNSGGHVEAHSYKHDDAPDKESPRGFEEARYLGHKRKVDIVSTLTPEALQVVAAGYRFADKAGAVNFEPVHLFEALLGDNRISNIFIRLGIPATVIQKDLETILVAKKKTASRAIAPTTSEALYAVLFAAYERAYELHQEYVSVTELLEATVSSSSALQDVLFALDIDKQKLINVVAWVRIRENLHRRYQKFRHAAGRRSTKGMDRAYTALATPFLNQFSEDVTLHAQFGGTETCVARETETEEIFRVIEGGGMSVLLVGDVGTGKRSIVEGVAERMVVGDVPDRLYDKRLVRLSTSALLAGTSPAGAVERLRFIMTEIARARNIILFINNIHDLVGVSAGGQESLDVAGTLAEFLNGGRFLTIATTTNEAFSHSIARSALGSTFAKVEVREMDENQAIQVLESKVGYVEYKHQVFFSYGAVEKAVQFAKRYLHDLTLPGSAQELLTEAASYTKARKGVGTLVTGEEVAAVVAEKTKIPVTSVTADETSKLLNLEAEMHKRVIGQDEAVNLVANALRRSRAEVRSQSRPIANFLFLGPTGVGKTELAKTIAEVYFGGENRMTRLDMSEYQDRASIYRLIGTPNEKGSGVLTETIRREPFTLLLLDEIEKADSDILNLFLQVMDDGRLSDSTGKVVDFTNVILIATSNAGTQFVADQIKQGLGIDAIKDRLLHGELKQYFKPEFLNRFDGIVLFKPLNREDIKQVASLMLARVAKDLEQKGITLTVEPAALEFLATVGFDPEFGARPMRRALEEKVENKLAELLLSGRLKRHDTVVFGTGGALTVV